MIPGDCCATLGVKEKVNCQGSSSERKNGKSDKNKEILSGFNPRE
jgi:hypothetical protein